VACRVVSCRVASLVVVGYFVSQRGETEGGGKPYFGVSREKMGRMSLKSNEFERNSDRSQFGAKITVVYSRPVGVWSEMKREQRSKRLFGYNEPLFVCCFLVDTLTSTSPKSMVSNECLSIFLIEIIEIPPEWSL